MNQLATLINQDVHIFHCATNYIIYRFYSLVNKKDINTAKTHTKKTHQIVINKKKQNKIDSEKSYIIL